MTQQAGLPTGFTLYAVSQVRSRYFEETAP